MTVPAFEEKIFVLDDGDNTHYFSLESAMEEAAPDESEVEYVAVYVLTQVLECRQKMTTTAVPVKFKKKARKRKGA
jgi:hypothetical protein